MFILGRKKKKKVFNHINELIRVGDRLSCLVVEPLQSGHQAAVSALQTLIHVYFPTCPASNQSLTLSRLFTGEIVSVS